MLLFLNFFFSVLLSSALACSCLDGGNGFLGTMQLQTEKLASSSELNGSGEILPKDVLVVLGTVIPSDDVGKLRLLIERSFFGQPESHEIEFEVESERIPL